MVARMLHNFAFTKLFICYSVSQSVRLWFVAYSAGTLLIPFRKYYERRRFADGTRHSPRQKFLAEDAQVFCNLHPVISTNYCPLPSAEGGGAVESGRRGT
jgi:hypothetical protein